jgi:hypothetical protein
MTELMAGMERSLATQESMLTGLAKLSKTYSDLSDTLRKIGAPGALAKSIAPCERAVRSIEKATAALVGSISMTRKIVANQSARPAPLSPLGGATGVADKIIEGFPK